MKKNRIIFGLLAILLLGLIGCSRSLFDPSALNDRTGLTPLSVGNLTYPLSPLGTGKVTKFFLPVTGTIKGAGTGTLSILSNGLIIYQTALYTSITGDFSATLELPHAGNYVMKLTAQNAAGSVSRTNAFEFAPPPTFRIFSNSLAVGLSLDKFVQTPATLTYWTNISQIRYNGTIGNVTTTTMFERPKINETWGNLAWRCNLTAGTKDMREYSILSFYYRGESGGEQFDVAFGVKSPVEVDYCKTRFTAQTVWQKGVIIFDSATIPPANIINRFFKVSGVNQFYINKIIYIDNIKFN